MNLEYSVKTAMYTFAQLGNWRALFFEGQRPTSLNDIPFDYQDPEAAYKASVYTARFKQDLDHTNNKILLTQLMNGSEWTNAPTFGAWDNATHGQNDNRWTLIPKIYFEKGMLNVEQSERSYGLSLARNVFPRDKHKSNSFNINSYTLNHDDKWVIFEFDEETIFDRMKLSRWRYDAAEWLEIEKFNEETQEWEKPWEVVHANGANLRVNSTTYGANTGYPVASSIGTNISNWYGYQYIFRREFKTKKVRFRPVDGIGGASTVRLWTNCFETTEAKPHLQRDLNITWGIIFNDAMPYDSLVDQHKPLPIIFDIGVDGENKSGTKDKLTFNPFTGEQFCQNSPMTFEIQVGDLV